MTAWSRKTWKFWAIFAFFKNDPSQTVATVRIAPKICQGQPPYLAHTVPDFVWISSLSAVIAELVKTIFAPYSSL